MHFLVMIAAAIIILSFIQNNPTAVGRFIGGYVIGIALFIVFVVFMMAGSHSHDQKVTMAHTSHQKSSSLYQVMPDLPKPEVSPVIPRWTDEDRANAAKLLRYGERRWADRAADKN